MWRDEAGLVEMLFTYIAGVQQFESYEKWRPVLVDILSCHEESRRGKENIVIECIEDEVRGDERSSAETTNEIEQSGTPSDEPMPLIKESGQLCELHYEGLVPVLDISIEDLDSTPFKRRRVEARCSTNEEFRNDVKKESMADEGWESFAHGDAQCSYDGLPNEPDWEKKIFFKIRDVERKVATISRIRESIDISTSSIFNNDAVKALPHENVDEFIEWSRRIKEDQDMSDDALRYLMLVGGSKPTETIKNILTRLCTRKVATMFSLKGRKRGNVAKHSFESLDLMGIISSAVWRHHPQVSITEIKSIVGLYLTQSVVSMRRSNPDNHLS